MVIFAELLSQWQAHRGLSTSNLTIIATISSWLVMARLWPTILAFFA
jgi:hypothetical protein